MKAILFLIISTFLFFSCSESSFNNGIIRFEPTKLTEEDKATLAELVPDLHKRYDSDMKMLTKELTGWNYHTDAESGTFHEVRASFNYAVMLLDHGSKEYQNRAFDIIKETISLQDQDTTSKSCGVWPYYLEEPLATKKAPIDYNWADFNAVSLLDVWLGHQNTIPENLKPEIKNSLILAAKSIQKRDVKPSYTNICIMGTYVTYMVSHLFDMPEMKDYARHRLNNFYNYTLDKGGFTEYNSPTYTIVALDELFRMKSHVVEPADKKQIDSLYYIGWETIARHYHKPSGQWSGPHSRSYSTLVRPSFYSILNEASNGKIDVGIAEKRNNVKIKHHIPEALLHYFLNPDYPRTEKDIFEKNEPQRIGTSYLASDYAISSVNRSSMWNQRRPLLTYWGDVENPHYLQARLLHDGYDFSSASMFAQQRKNNVLAAINFNTNGGDKHISIGRLQNGKFRAHDIRLRFELGNCRNAQIELPSNVNDSFVVAVEDKQLFLQLFSSEFDSYSGYWEKGSDDSNQWVDFVIYSGEEKDFGLSEMQKAVLAFTLHFGGSNDKILNDEVKYEITDEHLKAQWRDMSLNITVKPDKEPGNL